MSKKRKTLKQKKEAVRRHDYQISHNPTGETSYSVVASKSKAEKKENKSVNYVDKKSDSNRHLRKDITSIAAATGIVLAFDVLLLVLLSTGVLHLNFLGY